MNAPSPAGRVHREWRRFPVAARVVCAIIVPLAFLSAVTARDALRANATAEAAQALDERVHVLDRLVALHTALYSERVEAEVAAPRAGATSVATARPTARAATDLALAEIPAADRPFESGALRRLRTGVDGRAWTPSVLAGRFDDLQASLDEHLEAGLEDAADRTVALGDTRAWAAVASLRHSTELLRSGGALVTHLVEYWQAAPFEQAVTRSQLAGTQQRHRASAARFTAGAAPELRDEWTRTRAGAREFRAAVTDALEGRLSPLRGDDPTAAPPGRVLTAGLRATRDTGRLPVLAAADARRAAADLADDTRRRARDAALWAAASVLASLLAALWFGRSIVSPLRRVTRHARRIGEGDLDVAPLPLSGPPEVVDASRAFNDLMANLQLLDRKALALAACDLDAPVLAQPLPGRLGESLQRSAHVLSGSVVEREDLQRRLAHQATHDALTGIPNRLAVIDYLEHATARAGRSGRLLALVFIDIDRFGRVNDARGHTAGDAVLRAVAECLQRTIRRGDMVARFGGDEFLIVSENVDGIDEATTLARRALEAVASVEHPGGPAQSLAACAGVALAQDLEEPAVLIRNADMAVQDAKRAGTGRIGVFDRSLQDEMFRRRDVEEALRAALASPHELRLEYQPQVDSDTGRLTGVEALLRWDRPGHGPVPPDAFIPVAEDSALIVEVDRWVLREALRQLGAWSGDPVLRAVTMAVNVSGRHVLDPGFAPGVAEAMAGGPDPGRLILEVTETVLVTDIALAAAALRAVRDIGVRVAVDDFGTGYTSLAQLRTLPIDEIKIDRSFIAGLPGATGDAELVRMVCDLARNLGVPTVAEGVENDEQRRLLAEMRCDTIQGYFVARSMRPEALAAWAAARPAAPFRA